MSVLKSRKARALLAGGVVLGVGASMTLAAWSDSEWASGSFGTGGFTFQGSTDGTDFSEHPDSPGATLDFSMNPAAMTPGDSVTATYWVKATGASPTVTIKKPVIAGVAPANLTDALTVQYYADAACSGTAATTSGTLTGTSPVDDYALGTAADGVAVPTCIKITLDSNYTSPAGETTGAVSWEFAAATS